MTSTIHPTLSSAEAVAKARMRDLESERDWHIHTIRRDLSTAAGMRDCAVVVGEAIAACAGGLGFIAAVLLLKGFGALG